MSSLVPPLSGKRRTSHGGNTVHFMQEGCVGRWLTQHEPSPFAATSTSRLRRKVKQGGGAGCRAFHTTQLTLHRKVRQGGDAGR